MLWRTGEQSPTETRCWVLASRGNQRKPTYGDGAYKCKGGVIELRIDLTIQGKWAVLEEVFCRISSSCLSGGG